MTGPRVLIYPLPVARPRPPTESPGGDPRVERLIGRLPPRLARAIRWLRRPHLRWVRLPVGALFVLGGLLSILPLLGIWMLPVGLFLLSDDIPVIRRGLGRALDWIALHRPHWLEGR